MRATKPCYEVDRTSQTVSLFRRRIRLPGKLKLSADRHQAVELRVHPCQSTIRVFLACRHGAGWTGQTSGVVIPVRDLLLVLRVLFALPGAVYLEAAEGHSEWFLRGVLICSAGVPPALFGRETTGGRLRDGWPVNDARETQGLDVAPRSLARHQ